jgi:hypothetical protein
MPSTDRFAPSAARTEGETPVTESTVDATTADHVRQLLAEAKLVDSAFEPDPAVPASAATPTVPVPPPGYTLRTRHRTTADGGSEVEYEVVPLAPLPAAPATGALWGADGPERRSLPEWLTANRRTIKVAAYLAAGGALAAGAAVYGPAIGAGVEAAAAGLWSFTLTALKVIGCIVGGVLVLRLLIGGRRSPSGGTFEFSGTGRWKKD